MEGEKRGEIWQGTDFWTQEIERIGVKDQLLPFNDVLTGNEPPGYGGEPMVKDVVLGGILCDIYHTDYDKDKRDIRGNRIFIHKKQESHS